MPSVGYHTFVRAIMLIDQYYRYRNYTPETAERRIIMKEFNYIIKDEIGIHARPAGLLVKTAGKFSSAVKIKCGEKTADAKKLFAVMGLGAKCGSEITVTAEGADEDVAINELKSFLESNL